MFTGKYQQKLISIASNELQNTQSIKMLGSNSGERVLSEYNFFELFGSDFVTRKY